MKTRCSLRVFQHFGIIIGQDEIAAATKSSGERGTNAAFRRAFLEKYDSKYRVSWKEHFSDSDRRARMKLDDFEELVKKKISDGIPVFWVVKGERSAISNVGLARQTVRVLHMRLIVGYNEQTREILYSDTYGIGHGKKRMSVKDAWALTANVSSLRPTH